VTVSIAELFANLVADDAGVRFLGYDGSSVGPADAEVTVRITNPRVLGHLLRAPGGLGLGRAFVLGELTVDGDLHTLFTRLGEHAPDSLDRGAVVRAVPRLLRELRGSGAGPLRTARPPREEVRLHGRRHSRRRDAAAISHHYDLSNRFYELVLGPSMAYTCAVYPDDGATLEQAQFEKFDLVCRKLGLQPGQRLLDVGCGWGGMVVHAARHYGAQALGVTLSRRQAEYAAKAIAEAGVGDKAKVLHADYRDAPGAGYDAISSIGLTEHIGRAQYPGYFGTLFRLLRPGGRLLNHAIMRAEPDAPPLARRGFIGHYVFPDGELTALGPIVTAMQRAGFEPRHEENLREHYAKTLAAWGANLERNWEAAVAEVGVQRARVWQLYMAGSRYAFDRGDIQLHQVLAVRPDERHRSGLPLRPAFG
jgi:cyclopropane-fatty-acyl-phospholipid synthase